MSRHLRRAFAVHWSEVERWDPSSFETISWHWPPEVMVPLGSVLKVRKEKIDRSKVAFADLQPLSIHFDGSVSKRKVADGKEYTMDLWSARPGDIVVSKIDLKNGAVGIVPDDWGNVVVTGHFAVYEPLHDKVLPTYFHLLIQSQFFKDHLWRNKVGAEGRKEVKLDFFESELVPMPLLATQQAIVDHWQAAQKKNAAALRAADEHEMGVTSELSKALGLGDSAAPITRRAFAASWAQLQRWSPKYLRQSLADAAGEEETHPVATLGEVVADLTNGWSPKCHPRPAEEDEWGVLKLGAVSFGQYNEAENKALPRELKPDASLEIKAGDVLLSLIHI